MFFKDSVHTLIVRAFGYIFALGVQVLIANKLGAAAKGELQIVMFLFTVVALIVGMGFERSIIYFLSQNKYSPKTIWDNACSFLVGSLVLGFIVLLPLLKIIQPLLGQVRPELLLIIFIIVPVDRFFSFQLGVFNGLKQIRRGNIYSFVRSLIFAGLIGLFLTWIMPTSEGVLYAHFLAYLFAIITVIIFWRKDIGLSLAFAFDKKIIKEFFKFGSKGQIGNITNLIATRLDLIILNYYMGKAAAGVYSVAINFSELILFLPFIFAYVIFPHTSRRNEKQGWELTCQVTRISLFGTLIVALITAVFAPVVIKLIFTAEFWTAYKPLCILLPGMVLFSAFRIMASGISGLGYPFIYSICTIVTVLVSLSFNLWLIPKYQDLGAAMASSIAFSVAFLTLILIVKFKFKKSLKSFLLITKDDIILVKNHIIGILKR